MPVRNRERLRRLRVAVNYLVSREALQHGDQTRLAQQFKLSRQRVHQVVNEERQRLGALPQLEPALQETV